MDIQTLQLLAGSLSSLIFITGTFPMLVKAWRTKDLRSYSLAQLWMNTLGNMLHWLYITSLPLGPIWVLHSFHTATTLLMLVWALAYRARALKMIDLRRTAEILGLRRTTQEMAAR